MKKIQPSYVPEWERKLAIVLGLIIFLSGVYQTLFAETTIGILTLIAFVVITVPGFFTKDRIKKFPIEVEILLFFMVILQLVIGEARDFYTDFPYYDKIVHYMIPMFLGVIGFLIFYTLYATERLRTSVAAMMFIIVLMTMGLGSAWEILEYLSDVLILPYVPGWHQFQGSPEMNALNDTMIDLITDTFGAIFGAFLGLWIIGRNNKKGNRIEALIGEVSQVLHPLPKKKKKKKGKTVFLL